MHRDLSEAPVVSIYWGYNNFKNLEFDRDKKERTLLERGLDFTRATEIFEGVHLTDQVTRMAYNEDRFITVDNSDARLVVLVWTPRGAARRIIRMRKANDREKALYTQALEGPR